MDAVGRSRTSIRRRAFLGLVGSGLGAAVVPDVQGIAAPRPSRPRRPELGIQAFRTTSHAAVVEGEYVQIYDPSVDQGSPWMVNDHTIIRHEDRTWHLQNGDGEYMERGDYAGGTWRIAASEQPADTAFADALHETLNGTPT